MQLDKETLFFIQMNHFLIWIYFISSVFILIYSPSKN